MDAKDIFCQNAEMTRSAAHVQQPTPGDDWRLAADLRGCTLLRWRWCLTLTSTLSQGRPERWAVKSIVTSDSERFVTHSKMWLPFKWGVKGQSAFAAAERKRIKRISCSELDENKKKKNKNHVADVSGESFSESGDFPSAILTPVQCVADTIRHEMWYWSGASLTLNYM